MFKGARDLKEMVLGQSLYSWILIQFSLWSYTLTGTVRAVATAPENPPTEKVKFSELRDHHQSIPRQILPVKKNCHPLFTRCKSNTTTTTTTTTRRFKRHFAIE